MHGEIRLRVFNETSDLLVRRLPIRLRLSDGSERDAKLEAVRPTNKALLVRIAGVDDRDAAEALRGAFVCVSRDLFPPAEDGEFYACDIEGAEAVTAEGQAVGRVTGLVSYPSCDVLVIALGDPPEAGKKPKVVEVPLIDAYVSSVDVARQVVTLVTLEGLL
ncbi:ribosome maturation factor RimM [Chondromyces crocatus]|uniref:Ribosome maturation factor RimM n=1 Tax=Chondromyces crocatus TaxID=52 RepID=A0A0K1EGV0_CHOCO|nr:ribosome maturation factor RimM [Chondromyces crocatus]